MKIIFLDVDGVLNTPTTIRKFGFDFVDDILVALLARIVRETGSKIVLSSTWRVDEKDKFTIKQALSRHGLEIHDVTPILTERSPPENADWDSWDGWLKRSEEIQMWLDSQTVEKFAILDDLEDARIEGSFFQTDQNSGLTVELAEKVIQHLS